jgi:ATP-dependent exoDNAse (exonuclease V) alpha subunit
MASGSESGAGQPSDGNSAAGPPTEVLAGSIERVTFHNPTNGFCVLRIKARGHRDLVTVVGHAAEISAGEWVTVSGVWVNDRDHGLQFKAAFLRSSPPTSAAGIEKYLGSGMIRGIGPIYASKLVEAFGAAVFEVIEQAPERLREVPGIGQVRQQLLNPDPPEQVERFGWRFAPGDKVMQVANDYEKEVFNGDLGTIDAIDADNSELMVLFEGRAVTYGWGELNHLVLAYACTIHKSQGSEDPAVVIPPLTLHYAMLQRNLLYTGLSRGKRLVVLVGQPKALAMAVKNHRGRRRHTRLRALLSEGSG